MGLLLLLIAAVGGGYWFHKTHADEAKRIERQAGRDATFAEMKVVQAKMDLMDKYIAACKNHNAPDPKLDGAYDGFSYSKQSDYEAQKDEQEQRYKDLQARLDSAYGK